MAVLYASSFLVIRYATTVGGNFRCALSVEKEAGFGYEEWILHLIASLGYGATCLGARASVVNAIVFSQGQRPLATRPPA